MLAESHPLIRRILRFLALPYCYMYLVNWNECTATRYQVVKDLLYIFFRLKYYPDNYTPCRFWEKDRSIWNYYYGSSYDPYQRVKLRKKVQRYEYLFLFDDKEVCNLLCQGIENVCLPEYFGVISPDMDYYSAIQNIFAFEKHDKYIIKPVTGSAGRGILLAYRNGDEIKIKSRKTVTSLFDYKLAERAVVQEVVVQNEKVSEISPESVNTIRLVTLYTVDAEAIVISASMRFGVGDSFIDNWSAGGIAVGVNHARGDLAKIAYDKKGKQYYSHPVSGVEFEGFQVPYWDEVVQMALSVQKACPFFKLLGMDIAIADSGPVLIEVNPSTDIIFQEQTAGPLLEDRRTWEEFMKHDLLVNDLQKSLY